VCVCVCAMSDRTIELLSVRWWRGIGVIGVVLSLVWVFTLSRCTAYDEKNVVLVLTREGGGSEEDCDVTMFRTLGWCYKAQTLALCALIVHCGVVLSEGSEVSGGVVSFGAGLFVSAPALLVWLVVVCVCKFAGGFVAGSAASTGVTDVGINSMIFSLIGDVIVFVGMCVLSGVELRS
jgi:hypothetical protein